MKKYNCLVCGDRTAKPFRAVFEHFYIYRPGQIKYWRGNIKHFGFWSGLGESICLSFPIINTVANWKHRKSNLVIPVDSDLNTGKIDD